MKKFYPGIGQAVAERTILRKKENGRWENWGDVADRVALGNSLLCKDKESQQSEYEVLKKHIESGVVIMSGRHLQHGDEDQPSRNMELFTNCSVTNNSFTLFYLLMNGSGVGRSYDDDLMLIDWKYAPEVKCVLDSSHKDFNWSYDESVRDAKYKDYADAVWFEVPDTREGWAKALELYEVMAYENTNKAIKQGMLILDFSKVRPMGSPIKGMQGRPASGPKPLMEAFQKCNNIGKTNMDRWKQAMHIDHYFADCTLLGGVRRSSRMSTKTWKDKSVIDFIQVKRPLEYDGCYLNQVKEVQDKLGYKPQGFLWSSNNSVTVDEEFWCCVNDKTNKTDLAKHAREVFDLICKCSYGDGTGEPGLINEDRLNKNKEGLEKITSKTIYGGKKYFIDKKTSDYVGTLFEVSCLKDNLVIVNPCGEICIFIHGGYCTIADTAPYHAKTLDEAEEGFRAAVRALIRVNLMPALFQKEVERTNRIGIGITGIHEFAWKFFKLGFRDLIDEGKSIEFWKTLARFNAACIDEAISYSKKLGVNVPYTILTIKPSGSVSKLFGLSEGWHLPSMAYYLRWVQFRNDDPLIEKYKKHGYPIRQLKTYQNTTIVGFPTNVEITNLDIGDKLVTAAEATPEEQYKWLMLGEKYWINGLVDSQYGNQISYTLKYKPELVSYEEFSKMLLKYQSQIKCCSVMPQEKNSSYEYLPEEPISHEDFLKMRENIEGRIKEDVDFEHLACENGACPVDFKKEQ